MSKNDSDKQRRFSEEYCVDFCAKDAALRAGYKDGKGIRSQASELLARPHIQKAIQKRMSELAERCAVTTDSITKQLLDDRDFARQCGQAAAAVSASMGLAKLHGLIVDKKAETTPDGKPLPPTQIKVTFVSPDTASTEGESA